MPSCSAEVWKWFGTAARTKHKYFGFYRSRFRFLTRRIFEFQTLTSLGRNSGQKQVHKCNYLCHTTRKLVKIWHAHASLYITSILQEWYLNYEGSRSRPQRLFSVGHHFCSCISSCIWSLPIKRGVHLGKPLAILEILKLRSISITLASYDKKLAQPATFFSFLFLGGGGGYVEERLVVSMLLSNYHTCEVAVLYVVHVFTLIKAPQYVYLAGNLHGDIKKEA